MVIVGGSKVKVVAIIVGVLLIGLFTWFIIDSVIKVVKQVKKRKQKKNRGDK